MNKPRTLIDREDNWETDMGAWLAGERVVFRGKNLFTDLFDKRWTAIWYHTVTGRDFTDKQLELWDRLWVLCTSYPEPRIWNNRVAALSGTAKATAFQAVAAGVAASEGAFFGGQANLAAMEFIRRAKRVVVDDGHELKSFIEQEIQDKRSIPPGFGRPVIKSDERIPPATRLAKELGMYDGPHVKLALEIDKLLVKKRYRVNMNIGGLTAALCADQGLSPREFYCTTSIIYSAGFLACYHDAAHKPAGTFFPLRCKRISYSGQPHRKWEK